MVNIYFEVNFGFKIQCVFGRLYIVLVFIKTTLGLK